MRADRKKADKYLPAKSINERKKNPTDLADSLSSSVRREDRNCLKLRVRFMEEAMKRTAEYQEKWACVVRLNKCSDKILVEVFSKSEKITRRVIPKIYKKSLQVFENSDENMLRNIAVYYSGGVMGKRKYWATYRDSSYQRNSSKAVRIAVNYCPVPRLVPYNRLMPFIKSIDIGQLYSVRDTLCQGLAEEEKVDGRYRDIKELLLYLAKFYLCQSRYQLISKSTHSIFLLVVMLLHLERMILLVPGLSVS